MKYHVIIISLILLLAGSVTVLALQSDIESNAVLNPDRTSFKIPEWVKNNANWWSQDFISDEEFSYSMQYLLDQGIISCEGTC